MGKLSKRFRQFKAVKALMDVRSKLFSSIKGYDKYRDNIRSLKWKTKYYCLPRYLFVRCFLHKKYRSFRVFRPKSTFSGFDLSFIASDNNQDVFVQIVTKGHYKDRYDEIIRGFEAKEKGYKAFKTFLSSQDSDRAQYLPAITAIEKKSSFSAITSAFQHFTPLFEVVDAQDFDDQKRQTLITEVAKLETFFNDAQIFWHDATPHNVMLVEGSLTVIPVDFISDKTGSDKEIAAYNRISAQKLIDYFNTGRYFFEYR